MTCHSFNALAVSWDLSPADALSLLVSSGKFNTAASLVLLHRTNKTITLTLEPVLTMLCAYCIETDPNFVSIDGKPCADFRPLFV